MAEATAAPPAEGEAAAGNGQPADPPQQQFSFNVGGKKPTTLSSRLVGGSIELDKEFKKGERHVLRIEVETVEVRFRDQKDPKTGQIIGCVRGHKHQITGVSVIE